MWLIPGLGQEKYKMSINHILVPEDKEVLKKEWDYVKRTQEATWNISQWPNLE